MWEEAKCEIVCSEAESLGRWKSYTIPREHIYSIGLSTADTIGSRAKPAYTLTSTDRVWAEID